MAGRGVAVARTVGDSAGAVVARPVVAGVEAGAVLIMAGVEVAILSAAAAVVTVAAVVPVAVVALSEGPGEGRVRTRVLESSPQADNSKLPIKIGISSRLEDRNFL